MQNWEKFEKECAKHLKGKYKELSFKVTGGHDSNSNDIIVLKNNKKICSIECKMPNAQCGQFVLFIDKKNQTIVFSERNKTPYDKYVKAIIDEMMKNLDINNISSNENLPISEKSIINWVKNYYSTVKRAEYCITKQNSDYIIFPIKNIENYFSFSAKYRPKISGSSNPSKNNLEEIEQILSEIYNNYKLEFKGEECFVTIKDSRDKIILFGDKYRYQFSKENKKYKIRRLSNTKNFNFIVSIRPKNLIQKESDLSNFEKHILK